MSVIVVKARTIARKMRPTLKKLSSRKIHQQRKHLRRLTGRQPLVYNQCLAILSRRYNPPSKPTFRTVPIHFHHEEGNAKLPDPDHPQAEFENYVFSHAVWTDEEVEACTITHNPPKDKTEKAAYYTVQTLRFTWDLFSGYTPAKWLSRYIKMTRNMWLVRLLFLESVAGVPGMVFSMARHFKSLRRFERDYGWINSLLSEAENERMHLLTFMNLYQPGTAFRWAVVIAQGIMSNFFFIAYLIHPRYCHAVVGYLEEEAVVTYTHLIEAVKQGDIPEWLIPGSASNLSKSYWELPDDASWLHVLEQIRCDEAHHRDVNHTLAPLADKSGPESANPFRTRNINPDP